MDKIKTHTIDAEKYTLGRLASETAKILIGKHKPEFVYNLVSGDKVLIVNAEKVKLTGRKLEQKKYARHSGYLGNLKFTNLKDIFKTKPELVIEKAVFGMLPKNKLRKEWLKNLNITKAQEVKGA